MLEQVHCTSTAEMKLESSEEAKAWMRQACGENKSKGEEYDQFLIRLNEIMETKQKMVQGAESFEKIIKDLTGFMENVRLKM